MKHDSDILKRIKSYFMRRKSADEAHTFEKEVEKDAFLYEAMEGFEGMLTSDIQQAMDELDERLDAASKKFMFTINWGIAASIFALFSVGLTLCFTVFNSSSAENSVSKSEDEIYEPRDGETSFEAMGTYAFEYIDPKELVDSVVQMDDLEKTYAANEEAASSTPIPNEEPNKFKQGPPIIKEESSSTHTWNDVAINDNNAIVEDESDASAEEELKKTLIEPETADFALEEVADVIPTQSEMKRATPMGAVEVSSKPIGAAPKGGDSEYQSYVKRNLNTSEGMPGGSVILSFELDRNGKPKRISVVKSLCTACDAEAIRVLQNGPEWTAEDKKATGSVSIQFP